MVDDESPETNAETNAETTGKTPVLIWETIMKTARTYSIDITYFRMAVKLFLVIVTTVSTNSV